MQFSLHPTLLVFSVERLYLLFTLSFYHVIVFSQDVNFPGQVSILPLGEAWAEAALWGLVLHENGLSGDGMDAGQMCPKAAAAMRQQPQMPFLPC